MDVHELRHLAENRPTVLIYNPLTKNFKTSFKDLGEIELKGGEITSVEGNFAERIKKQLVTFIMNERQSDPLLDIDKIYKEIEVQL